MEDITVKIKDFGEFTVRKLGQLNKHYYPDKQYSLKIHAESLRYYYLNESEIDQLIEALTKIKNEQK